MADDGKRWGATPDEWAHLELILGLGPDLLPVVSRADAAISPNSGISKLGKVPSLYNKKGLAVGIMNWPSKRATEAELNRWAGVSDLGACVQTREARAIDIDVPDVALAGRIQGTVERVLGFALPVRSRPGTGKRLLAFAMPGEFGKRKIDFGESGIVEFLGTGCHFVCCGVHTSGDRYEWDGEGAGGLPWELPVLPVEVWEKVWAAMGPLAREARGAGGAGEETGEEGGGSGYKGRGAALPGVIASDEVSASLEILGLALKVGREGQVHIECPWVGEHTTAQTVGETTYFPSRGRGYERGHFKCLHAHCAGRGDDEFMVALGLEEPGGGFEVVTVPAGGDGVEILDRELTRNEDNRVLATLSNLIGLFSRPAMSSYHIHYDEFRDEIVYRRYEGDKGKEPSPWLRFQDHVYTEIRTYLERTGFNPVSKEMMRDVVHAIAKGNPIDTAQEWLGGLEWDGVKRIDRFLVDYMGAENTPYSQAVGRYIWMTLAGRVLSPGCKADAAPIFVGEQYSGKSFFISCMAPDEDYFAELRLDDEDPTFARKIRGKLIGEFVELRGLHTKDSETIKALISRRIEEWAPKFIEFNTKYKRRCLLIGTSNKDELFSDETGNRRWFPVRTPKGDCDALIRDRLQLWAEGKTAFQIEGTIKGIYEKTNKLAHATREEFAINDAWDEPVERWLDEYKTSGTSNLIQIGDILRESLGYDTKNIKMSDTFRVGRILRKSGYRQIVKLIFGKTKRGWGR